MTITAKSRSHDDILNVDSGCEIEFYADDKLVGTLTVYNPENGNSYIDYNNEINSKDYNLLHLSPSGAVENDVPTENDPIN